MNFQINSTSDRPTLVACIMSKMEGPNTADDKQVQSLVDCCHASFGVIGREVQAEAETLAFGGYLSIILSVIKSNITGS